MKYCDNRECHDGKIFNRRTRVLEDCLECKALANEQVRSGVSNGESLSESLGFRRMFVGLKFDPNMIFGSSLVSDLGKDVVKGLSDSIDGLISSLSMGNLPKSSLMYYLGNKSDLEMVAYLLIGSGYKAGLTFYPYLSASRLRGIRGNLDEMNKLVFADVVVANLVPSIWEDVNIFEDLLKERAFYGKPTIFLIGNGSRLNSTLLRMGSDSEMRLDLCLYAGIPMLNRDESEEDRIKRVNNVIGFGNTKLKTSTPELTPEEVEKLPRVSAKDIWG